MRDIQGVQTTARSCRREAYLDTNKYFAQYLIHLLGTSSKLPSIFSVTVY
jgi:hypothetical protein